MAVSQRNLRYYSPPLSNMLGLIKVCGDPHCGAVWHNIPKNHTHCKNWDGRVIIINEETYWKKFSNEFFQYEFETEEYFRPTKDENPRH